MLKEDGVGAVLAYLKGMASLMNTLVRRILNAITVDRFHLSLTVAGGDAAETALLHAAACSIVFPALSSVQYVLENPPPGGADSAGFCKWRKPGVV